MNSLKVYRPERGVYLVDPNDPEPYKVRGKAVGNAFENYIFDMFSELEYCKSTQSFGKKARTTSDIVALHNVHIEVKSHRALDGIFNPVNDAEKVPGLKTQIPRMRNATDTFMVIVGVYEDPVLTVSSLVETEKNTMQYQSQPEVISYFEEQYTMYVYMEHKDAGCWAKLPRTGLPIWEAIDVTASPKKSLKQRIMTHLSVRSELKETASAQKASTYTQENYPFLQFETPEEDKTESLAASNMFEAISTYMITLVDNQSATDRSELEDAVAMVKSAMMADLSKVKDVVEAQGYRVNELSIAQVNAKLSIRGLERDLNDLGSVQSDDVAALKRRISTLEEKVKQSKFELEQARQNATCLGNNLNGCLESYNELESAFQASTIAHDAAIRYLYDQLGVDIEEAFSDEG
jgi:hypothetical protein